MRIIGHIKRNKQTTKRENKMIKVKYGTAYATSKTSLNKKAFAEHGKIITYTTSVRTKSVEIQDGKYKEVTISDKGVTVNFYNTLAELKANMVINTTREV